jgi:hypothetical protein
MPRGGSSFLSGSQSSTSFLPIAISISNTNIYPVQQSGGETLMFTQLRQAIAETMSRIIRRDPDVNGVLGTIAQSRLLLKEITRNF